MTLTWANLFFERERYKLTDLLCENAEKKVDILREDRICNGGRDCCEVFRKELFTKYPFPVFPGEKFIGEGAAFYFIERSSKGVYYNRILYICNYRDDGLTKAGRQMRIRNPLGGKFNSNLYMDKRLPTKTRIKKQCYMFVMQNSAAIH